MSIILTNRMFRGRNTVPDRTMRRLLLAILTVNYVQCASTMGNETMKPATACTLTNITNSQLSRSSCDSEIIYLFIKDSRLDVFPHVFDFFPNLQSVDLSSAGVQRIEPTTFDTAIHLATLDMCESNMRTLTDNLFKHVSNLTSLDIANSSIEIVEKYAFHGLSNLKRLDLSGNKIIALQSELFQPLSRLETIRLGNNRIEVISRDLFMHNSELMWVYLNGNEIISVDPNSFSDCKLKSLDLGSNQLRDLELIGMTNLKELIVTDNQLNVLQIPSTVNQVFAKNNSIAAIHSDDTNELTRLHLGSNHFTNFQSLSNLRKLVLLDLSNNHLRNFIFSDVKPLTHLKELQLCKNKLPEIRAADVITNLPELKFIEVSTKHWSDSHAEQLKVDLDSHNITFSQDRSVLPDDDSLVTSTVRPTPVTSRTTVTTQSPNSDNIEQRLNEIRKQLSDLAYRTGANAAADSKRMDRRLADVEEKLMKSNGDNDAKLEGVRSSFKVYEVLVIIMFVSVTAFVLYQLVLHSKRMLNGMHYRRTQSSDPIFSEQDL